MPGVRSACLLVACVVGVSCSSLDPTSVDSAAPTQPATSSTSAEAATSDSTTNEDSADTNPDTDSGPEPADDTGGDDTADKDTGGDESARTGTTEVGDSGGESEVASLPSGPIDGVRNLVATVVNRFPHDTIAFTQGLTIHDGVLIESIGLYGSSARRTIAVESGDVVLEKNLSPDLFGNGITVIDDTLVQLTWREGVAILADPTTLEVLDRFTYEGEGWGLCSLGETLVMSNGSNKLTLRDPVNFDITKELSVTLNGAVVDRLSELACRDGSVWASVWLTTDLFEIDPSSGVVLSRVDASALAPDDAAPEDVLNGLVAVPESDTFYLTGKRWDTLYEVAFKPL